MVGALPAAAGSVAVVPSDATVGLLAQELDARPGETVADFVARRVGVAAASAELDAASDGLQSTGSEAGPSSAALDRHQRALDRWMRLGGADLDARLDATLAMIGFAPPATDGPGDFSADGPVRDLVAETLSGGEQARVGLAALIVARFDVLLLDEPTNNLDGVGLAQLEAFVLASRMPMIIVSHDRRFLERTVTGVFDFDEHERTITQFNERWVDYLRSRELAAEAAARRYADYSTRRQRLSDRAEQQRQWAAKGVRAEANPPDNDRAARGARIERTEKQAGKARQTERAIERLAEVEKPWEPWRLQFTIGRTDRSGDLVAELVDAVVSRGEFQLGPISLSIGAGERVAIEGGNGAGKTTLIDALLGRIDLTSGTQRTGRSVVLGRLDQERRLLSAETPFLDRFSEETGLLGAEARGILAKFGLGANHLDRPSIDWSAGERTRAVLAAFQAKGVNTLVLDEPTNHLDLAAIEQLEQALGQFDGTLLLVTHDRAFLDGVTLTRTVRLDDGRITADHPI